MKKVYAFVFARGGSKGLPRKNVLLLDGIPLVARSIIVAKEVERVSKVFVSTDDPEIKKIARENGAEIIERPSSLCTDSAPEWASWEHAVDFIERRGDKFDVFLSLPATSPLRSIEDVNNTLDCLDTDVDVALTVSPAARSPYFNMVERLETGETKLAIISDGYSRRQDVPLMYDLTTVAYALRTDFIKKNQSIFEGRVRSVVVPKERAVDIDDVYDFKFAEMILQGAI